jgi:hypothetical protein
MFVFICLLFDPHSVLFIMLDILLLSFRSCKQVQKLNKSVWNVNSAISSSALLESAHALQLMVYPLTLFFKMFESFS